MANPRSELRDELAALIAAGRELTPDHDQVLADVFVDHVARRMAAPPATRKGFPVWAKSRRLLAAAFLVLAGLGTASVMSTQHTQGVSQVPALSAKVPAMGWKAMPAMGWKAKMVPLVPRVPHVPPKLGPKNAP